MDQKLTRNIGLFALTVYGVGDILGAGIYGLVGKAAGQMGNAVWLAFLVGMLAAIATGLTYAALGSVFPKAAGSSYIFQKVFKNSFMAYTLGLVTLFSGFISMAAASRIFSGYLSALAPALPFELCLIGFISLIAAIVYLGIKESIWVNTLCTFIEIAGLLFIIAVGVSFWGQVDYLDATTTANPTGDLSLALVMSGAILTFYSFIGFEDMLNVSEEVIEPHLNLPKALLYAIFISSLIYMLVSITAVSVVPPEVLASSKEPLVEVVRKAAPWFPSKVYSFIAMFAVANTALLNFVMGSRLLYGLSRLKLMPAILTQLHPKRKTPTRAIILIYTLLMGLAFSAEISTLARATSLLLLCVFLFMNIALLKMKKEKQTLKFQTPAFVPAVGACICVALIFFAKQEEIIYAGIAFTVICGLYFILRPKATDIEQME